MSELNSQTESGSILDRALVAIRAKDYSSLAALAENIQTQSRNEPALKEVLVLIANKLGNHKENLQRAIKIFVDLAHDLDGSWIEESLGANAIEKMKSDVLDGWKKLTDKVANENPCTAVETAWSAICSFSGMYYKFPEFRDNAFKAWEEYFDRYADYDRVAALEMAKSFAYSDTGYVISEMAKPKALELVARLKPTPSHIQAFLKEARNG